MLGFKGSGLRAEDSAVKDNKLRIAKHDTLCHL